MKPPIIIAEIGCNHKGDIEIARELVAEAHKFCSADVVKFQKRTPKELLTKEEYSNPHPELYHSYGKTYGEHRDFLEFTVDQHKELKDFCEELGITYSTSVWDLTAAKEITALRPQMIKIPSACNTDHEMLSYIFENFDGDVHISLGMTTPEEERKLTELLDKNNAWGRTILYACTSGYPVPFEEIYLYELPRLKKAYGDKVKAIGFSGHHLGVAADIAAMTLGAEYIERHFTLDRTWRGTDHAASLEPGGLRKLVRDLKNVHRALEYKHGIISPSEEANRQKLKRIKELKQ